MGKATSAIFFGFVIVFLFLKAASRSTGGAE